MRDTYDIYTIKDYPDDGNHLECSIPLPFQIRRGEDGYYYNDKHGIERKYNLFKNENKIDDRWIVHIDGHAPGVNESLERIFHIMVDEDLDKIVEYCYEVYEKSLKMELKRIANDMKRLRIVLKPKLPKTVGVIALNVDDFQSWRKSKKHHFKGSDTINRYMYRGTRYVCLSSINHPVGYSFDKIVETERACLNKSYLMINEMAKAGLKTQKYVKANSN